jgi:hypothetical protein
MSNKRNTTNKSDKEYLNERLQKEVTMDQNLWNHMIK